MSINQVAEFSGLHITIHDISGTRWITAPDVGRALGYAQPENVMKIYNRHADEFGPGDTRPSTLEGRVVRLFSATGCALLSMFANTPRAKDFRAWAKRVLAGELPAPAPTSAVEQRLDRIEDNMGQLAGHMKDLVQVSVQQATKLELTQRYIGLLEMNQRHGVKVTPQIERECLELYTQGMRQVDIARLLRLSTPTVGQIVKGKYALNALTRKERPPESLVQAAIERNLEEERKRLAEAAQRRGGTP